MPLSDKQLEKLAKQIKQWALSLGFQQVGISDLDLTEHEAALQNWLDKGYHGEMDYMARHGTLRTRPAELHPGSVRCISVRMDYLPPKAGFAKTLKNPHKAYISRYALGRDYHKTLRNKLKKLGQIIEQQTELNIGFRPFVDSAPILERPLAVKAGLGWTGKHSLVLDAESGSWFFLGELLINLPLPVDHPKTDQCGSCVACMTICPTNAIVEPYQVDANKCISYLTIEYKGSIPLAYRKAIGNRIYGCDDCQLICPWNRFAKVTSEGDFSPRQQIDQADLLSLWQWSEQTFLNNTQGSAIRRIGYRFWQRNLAVAMGNAPASDALLTALKARLPQVSDDVLLSEHIEWAIKEQQAGFQQNNKTRRLIKAVEKGLPRDA
ncbi:tRNA epoxyqueuosine(34) reductase QueG [Gayadomonas joobiniege]|uniref:tRNA epoxyqueuosine(34) reductase QueG n=1 Tax=Gayadomonas joobiniege TaxID=1234606 RepID=UPI00037C0829|nr:tRNA epoxyqueuosine(34) reductase QueG [Gayadomonas joobiniege]